MRKILVSVLVVLSVLGVAAYAQIASIKQDMIAISKLAKQIRATVNDPSQNQQNANNANQIAQLFQDTMNQVPEIISEFPANQQQGAFAGYQQDIQTGINIALQLQNALNNNDNATAANLIQQLFQLEDDGHSRYNP